MVKILSMPANLTPQYFDAEKKYKEAKTNQEKLLCLQEMLATIPKHKGTEKLQADIKSKISKLKDMPDKVKKGSGPSSAWYQVDKQGAGQVVLCGIPNSGKSSLLNALTNTRVEVADYPFTTVNPQIGMMDFEDIKIQIVDTPPLADTAQPWLYAIYRAADFLLILVDASDDDLLSGFENLKARLVEHKIDLTGTGENSVKSLILLTKIDKGSASENAKIFREMYSNGHLIREISVSDLAGIAVLKRDLFDRLNIIRVYTKKIGHPPAKHDPVILKNGTTVLEAAEHIHKDFKQNLQFTKLWNDAGFTGQRIEKTHVLKDGDIIEFHV
jgi:small GTP-binding protein